VKFGFIRKKSLLKTPRRKAVRRFLNRLKRSSTGIIGLIIILTFCFMTILAPALAPYPYTEFHIDDAFHPPSARYILGTDQYGRDMLSRIIIGSRSLFATAVGIALISVSLGILIGFTAGYFGGLVDEIIMRFMDILMSIPSLLLAMVMLGLVVRPGIWSVMLIIAVVFSPRTARVARGALLEQKSLEFVDAARVRGESFLSIVFYEIFPNTLGPLIVEGTARFAYAIMAVASLGFLGVGLRPPTPDWGLMVAENKEIIFDAPWSVIFPALAIALLVIGVSLFAEFLDDYIGGIYKRT